MHGINLPKLSEYDHIRSAEGAIDPLGLYAIADRLRGVRVCCGDWTRVLGPTPTVKRGLTGVFLDPPYADEQRDSDVYSVDSMTVARDVAAWAIAHGDDPDLRIALCGYEGETEMPDSWECVPWKAPGGYGSQGDKTGRENAHRERVWFSPHCKTVDKAQQLLPFGPDDPVSQKPG